MKLILCLLPLLCLVLYFNSVDAGVSVPEMVNLREARSTEEEDPDITDDGEENDSDKDEGVIASEDGDEDDTGFVLEPQGKKKLKKLNEKTQGIFANKTEEEIIDFQKKLAELKFGAGHNR